LIRSAVKRSFLYFEAGTVVHDYLYHHARLLFVPSCQFAAERKAHAIYVDGIYKEIPEMSWRNNASWEIDIGCSLMAGGSC
jgi:hypothetical protein